MKSNYNIPINTFILKISTFYVNLNNDINQTDTIKLIGKYLFSNISNVEIDILCIQGINEQKLLKDLINELKNNSFLYKIPINIAPNIDTNNSKSINNYIQSIINNNTDNSNSNINSIIISKYPILTTTNIILNDSYDEKLVGSRKGVLANININGYLISIYNIILSEDYLGISNIDYRKNEINKLIKYIYTNNEEIINFNNKYELGLINKNINIICGNFNLPEIKEFNINPELSDIFRTLKAIDTYRIKEQPNNIKHFTNIKNFKHCYILLLINNLDFSTNLDVLNYSYKYHGIIVIKSYIVKHIISNDNYPLETIFLMNNIDKKSLDE